MSFRSSPRSLPGNPAGCKHREEHIIPSPRAAP